MSGKKGKKIKSKPMSFQDFMKDSTTTAPTTISKGSWADDLEDDEYSYSSRSKEPVVLPTAPRAARDESINEENIPTQPPYVAYISNLPYDVDEEDLIEFFADMDVDSVRLPKDQSKFRGYGYVEFKDRKSLIDALSLINPNLKSRSVRIEVSNSSNDERRGRMGRMGDSRREYDDPERTTGDWRSARAGGDDDDGGRSDDRFRSSRGGGGFDRRDRDDNRDSGFEDNKPGNWRNAPRADLGSDRPPRREGGSERENYGGRFSDRGPRRDGSRDRDDRDRGSSFGPRRNFDDADRDRDRWSSMRSQPRDMPSGPADDMQRTRPKLDLKPRSKPVDSSIAVEGESNEVKEAVEPKETESREVPATPTPAPAPVPAGNIFGAARPVDTAAREREIEERLAAARSKDGESGADDRRREPAWGRRNGEGRESRFDDMSRSSWRTGPRAEPNSRDPRESRDPRDSRDLRDSRDQRDHRDFRDSRDSREPRRTSRDSRDARSGSRGSSSNRGSALPPARVPPQQIDSRPPPDGEEGEKNREEEEISRMPKAKDDQAPNFIASNKYSMLPDDVDPDNIEE